MFRSVGHGHDNIIGARYQIHGATHALDQFAGDHIGGDITLTVHFKSTQHRQIDMTATNHSEGLRGGEN